MIRVLGPKINQLVEGNDKRTSQVTDPHSETLVQQVLDHATVPRQPGQGHESNPKTVGRCWRVASVRRAQGAKVGAG